MTQGFLDAVTQWENSAGLCMSPNCPIRKRHNPGRYLHKGKRNHRDPAFGSCDPPPEIWAALDRSRAGKGNAIDVRLVDNFRRAHVLRSHGIFGPSRVVGHQWQFMTDSSIP
ncbi:hypothetical protein N7G274_003149 [Stereocaulon virgatum]|uniref:Uncharacterized protein n=1 Tax=Stereocaulon virgatum TaxID=373712 RepID=A0ABR4AF40_9LECA